MMASCMVAFARIFAGATARWVNCEPSARQRIYFANHTSNLDFVVLWASLPQPIRIRTRPVAAHDYWTASPLRLYFASRVFNAVLIERKKVTVHNNPVALMLGAIGKDYSLIIFPEGGRNPGPEPGPFKSGLYHLGTRRPDIELVPVFIDNANRILPKGEVLPVPLISCIRFGPPMRVAENERKDAFLVRARQAVIDLAGC